MVQYFNAKHLKRKKIGLIKENTFLVYQHAVRTKKLSGMTGQKQEKIFCETDWPKTSISYTDD
jgi:hypothetical protein